MYRSLIVKYYYSEHYELMKLLLDYGADLEAMTSMKRRALHFAVLAGDIEYVDYLVRCGAEVDCLDTDKESPLHYASRLGYSDMVEYLLGKCSLLTNNVYGESALDLSANIDIHKVRLY
jgi:ankyrin repeat protein